MASRKGLEADNVQMRKLVERAAGDLRSLADDLGGELVVLVEAVEAALVSSSSVRV
jgi:hypothetical protein